MAEAGNLTGLVDGGGDMMPGGWGGVRGGKPASEGRDCGRREPCLSASARFVSGSFVALCSRGPGGGKSWPRDTPLQPKRRDKEEGACLARAKWPHARANRHADTDAVKRVGGGCEKRWGETITVAIARL